MARLAAGFERLLAALAERPETALAELPLLGEGERHQLLREWSSPACEAPGDATVHELVAARAAAAPDAVALVVEGGASPLHLTYGDLAARAGRLAARLDRLGVGPEVPVAVAMERSAELTIALLAILESGGAYLPLDLADPAERLAWMLADLRPPLLLTTAAALPAVAALATGATRVLALDRGEEREGRRHSPLLSLSSRV